MTQSRCIYCPNEFDANAGEGDHVIPASFGEFQGAVNFRGACEDCNNSFGALEEELLRTAPEAIFRRLAGITTTRRGKDLHWVGTADVPPPQFTITHDSHEELFVPDSQEPQSGSSVDQLVVKLKGTKAIHIRLFPGMTAEAVRRKFTRLGIAESDIEATYWHADAKVTDDVKRIMRELWPTLEQHELPETPIGIHRVPVRIRCAFTIKYYRAIAKIAFHYFLVNSRYRFTGHEELFAPIKRFISAGGNRDDFFEKKRLNIHLPFRELDDGTAILSARWMHLICCEESLAEATVAVHTLFGPQRLPDPHSITIFERPVKLFVPRYAYSHAYIYGDGPEATRRNHVVGGDMTALHASL